MKNFKKINWKRMLLDNWVLKLVSLIIAFTLWFVVITVDDPVKEKSFSNIKVNLINTEQLAEMGKVYEVLDNTNVLRSVTFEAPNSILDEIEPEDIIAEADIDYMTDINMVPIKITCPKYSRDVTNLVGNINNVKLKIDNKVSKWVNIVYNVIGKVADNYMIDDNGIRLGQNRLQIEGPETTVDQIKEAVVDIDVSGITNDISSQFDIYMIDGEGNIISSDSLSLGLKSVSASVDVLTTKEIPVSYHPSGETAEGYLATGEMKGTPDRVLIAGNEPTISKMKEIIVSEELDLTGATESLVKTIELEDYLLPGIIFADETFDGKAQVEVYVEEVVERSLKVRRNNLQVINVPDGILAEVAVEQNWPALVVSGLERNVSHLNESTITGTIDVGAWMEIQGITELTTGLHSLPIDFRLEEGQNITETVYIEVNFSEVEESF